MSRKPKEPDEEGCERDEDLLPSKERSYYYDDAHGYEEYDPADESEDETTEDDDEED